MHTDKPTSKEKEFSETVSIIAVCLQEAYEWVENRAGEDNLDCSLRCYNFEM